MYELKLKDELGTYSEATVQVKNIKELIILIEAIHGEGIWEVLIRQIN